MKEFFKNFGAALLSILINFLVVFSWTLLILGFACIGKETPWMAVLLFVVLLAWAVITVMLTISAGALVRGKWQIGNNEIKNKED